MTRKERRKLEAEQRQQIIMKIEEAMLTETDPDKLKTYGELLYVMKRNGRTPIDRTQIYKALITGGVSVGGMLLVTAIKDNDLSLGKVMEDIFKFTHRGA